MEVISAFLQGGVEFFGSGWLIWAAMLFGVVFGLIFGILPGVSGLTAMAILLPFVFKIQEMFPDGGVGAKMALGAFCAIACTSATGGSLTAILLNVPGDTANAATLLDGYPMTKKGQAGRAIGAAMMSHAVGGGTSALMSIGLIPVLLPILFAMRTGDLVFVILLAFACVGVLSSQAPLKGMIACCMGVMLAFVGAHVTTGTNRYTLDAISEFFGNQGFWLFFTVYLTNGLPIVAVAMGLFACTELVDLAVEGESIAKKEDVNIAWKGVFQGMGDVFRHWSLWIRGSIIGFVVGIIPGVGTSASPWMAYGQAKQTSKHPELYGTGYVGGVIAPELTIGAVVAGDLLTTLALGIPGSVQMVMILAALMVLGYRPGPEMVTTELPATFGLLQVFVAAKFMAVIICLLIATKLARVAAVPQRYLFPIVIGIIFIGTYATEGRWFDLITLLVFTAIGLFMREYGFSIPPLVIGFVLGDSLEKYLSMAYFNDGPLFWVRPISLVLIFLNLVVMFWPQIASLWEKKPAGGEVKS